MHRWKVKYMYHSSLVSLKFEMSLCMYVYQCRTYAYQCCILSLFSLLVDIASRLFVACKSGDLQAVQELLKESSYASDLLHDTHVPDRGKNIGEKTIVAAALSGSVEVVKLLLNENANVNVSTPQGSPIYAASKNGHLAVVNLLLEWGAEFRHIKSGFSPVFAACLEGHLNILKVLVKKGGVGVLSGYNPPLIVTTCTKGHLEVVNYLLQMTSFDINKTFRGKDVMKEEKDSLLYIACSRGKPAIVNYLISKGAVITKGMVTKFSKLLISALEQKLKEVETRPQGKGPVVKSFEACWNGLQMIELPTELVTSLPQSLTSIDLSESILESLPEELFTLPNLQSLNVSHNRLTELTSEDFPWTCHKYVPCFKEYLYSICSWNHGAACATHVCTCDVLCTHLD